MIEATAPSQDLKQFDVWVKREGWFSVFAESQAIAEAKVNAMTDDDFDRRVINWTGTEVIAVD